MEKREEKERERERERRMEVCVLARLKTVLSSVCVLCKSTWPSNTGIPHSRRWGLGTQKPVNKSLYRREMTRFVRTRLCVRMWAVHGWCMSLVHAAS